MCNLTFCKTEAKEESYDPVKEKAEEEVRLQKEWKELVVQPQRFEVEKEVAPEKKSKRKGRRLDKKA